MVQHKSVQTNTMNAAGSMPRTDDQELGMPFELHRSRARTHTQIHPAYLPSAFETIETVKGRRARLVGQLARSPQAGATALAALLAECAKGRRCGSGACPICQRLWRRDVLRAADAALDRRGPLTRISWVPAGGLVPLGELPAFDLRRFVASRRRALQRALPGVAVFGGIDVSHNTELNDAGLWQVHLYLVAEAADTPELRRAVRKRCPGEPSAPRPFLFKEVTRRVAALSYAVKAGIYRRSSYMDGAGRRNARPQALHAERAVEAALFLDRWSPEQRLLLRRLRLTSEGARLRLRRLTDEPVVEGRGLGGVGGSLECSGGPARGKVEPFERVGRGGGV